MHVARSHETNGPCMKEWRRATQATSRAMAPSQPRCEGILRSGPGRHGRAGRRASQANFSWVGGSRAYARDAVPVYSGDVQRQIRPKSMKKRRNPRQNHSTGVAQVNARHNHGCVLIAHTRGGALGAVFSHGARWRAVPHIEYC